MSTDSPPAADVEDGARPLTLTVNGQPRTLRVPAQATLVDTLRDRLGLFGTKVGCAHGQCGACTVLINGERRLSCLTLALLHDGDAVTTIEGVAGPDGALHPLQQAFMDHDAFQCGFCTPGQIMSALGLMREGGVRTDEDIRERLGGNLCRCAAYPHIVAAVRQVLGPVQP